MKKALCLALCLTSSAYAATTATLLLKGSVPTITEILVTPDAAAQTLSVTAGTSALKVASVTETCNSRNGYDIFLSSLNGGKLVHTIDATKSTTYQLSYATASLITPSTTATKVKSVTSLSALTTQISDVKVSVVAAPGLIAGDYVDTVTLSIVAK